MRRPSIYDVVDHKWFDQETKKQIDRFEWRSNFIPTLDDLGDCRSGFPRLKDGRTLYSWASAGQTRLVRHLGLTR